MYLSEYDFKLFRGSEILPETHLKIQPNIQRNGAAGSSSQPLRPNEDGSHHLQEYTYKKITACDVCSQILRGHTRQGLRCRICKLNAHGDCASQLPRCQPKQKLLRRQKSTSELENRIDIEEEIFEFGTIYF
ncbi:hypothetical protein FF38_00618 [Lucilia cuprina]|uniref:Phorbol-ester/DAG-type domain-containing protein n=1 Tax=Lucilia cuprina TaxID=7375 RepID=A0A0L0BXR1_LUCCU|nr:hypothetical protein FF38_00618 [Lucilia cuprina]